MPLACAAELAENVVRLSAAVQFREDVVEHEDRDADRRDSHSDDHECLEGGHVGGHTRARGWLTLRITRPLREAFPPPPLHLVEEYAAEFGELVGWVVEDGENHLAVLDAEPEELRLTFLRCFEPLRCHLVAGVSGKSASSST